MFTIFRTKKLKTRTALAAAGEHNNRKVHVPNANTEKKNIVIVECSNNILDDFDKKISNQKVRKNAVLAVESILTASPEFFLDKSKFMAWRKAAEQFIKKEFPNAISVVLHLDESTPHYHILDVPLDSKGKLNARAKYGGRQCMIDWQDKAAAPFTNLGLNRGVKGSKAKHEKVKRHYSIINRPINLVFLPNKLPKRTITENIPYTEKYNEREEKEKKFNIRMNNFESFYKNNYVKAITKARSFDTMKKENEQLKKQLVDKDKQLEERKELADKLRALPLYEVLIKMYKAEEDKSSNKTHKSRKFNLPNGMGQFGLTENLWIKQGDKGGKGAIDLVMFIEKCSFNEAIKLMSEYFSTNEIVCEYNYQSIEKNKQKLTEKIAKQQTYVPRVDDTKKERIITYLTEKRKLPEKLVKMLIEQDKIYGDYRGNVVFLRQKGGAFLRGTTESKFHMTIGLKEDGGFLINGDKSGPIYLTESPIDSLAIKAMIPTATTLAIGGNLLKIGDIAEMIKKTGRPVIACFDNDKTGQRLTEESVSILGATKKPPPQGCKDWAEAVQKDPSLIDRSWLYDQPTTVIEPEPSRVKSPPSPRKETYQGPKM